VNDEDNQRGTEVPQAHPRQRRGLGPRQVLVLLGLIFVAPGLLAWLMHMKAEDGWLTRDTTNKGTLIQPARPLSLPEGLIGASGAPFPPDFLKGKWTLLYIGDTACTDPCRKSLYALRQVRLAQGENMRRVQRLFLVTDSGAANLRSLLADYPDMAVAFAPVPQTKALAPLFSVEGIPMKGANRVYLVDPLGNLMMYYRPDSDPRGMIRDLEKLLKYSHVG